MILKPMTNLAGLRRDFVWALEQQDVEDIKRIVTTSARQIAELEKAVANGKFLEETYRFNPSLVDKLPNGVTPQEELWARSGVYIAW